MLIPFNHLFTVYNIQSKGVLHVGANEGQESEAYRAHGIEKIIWVEAIPEIVEKLKENIKPHHDIIIEACVGDENGKEVLFHISNNEGQSSSFLEFGTHTDVHPTVKYTETRRMRTFRLDTLLKGILDDSYDFLNIDLQGAELMALKGMGDMLKQFNYAYLEVNKKETYKGCALIDEVEAYIGQFGFVRAELHPWVGDTWSDAFYINKRVLKL